MPAADAERAAAVIAGSGVVPGTAGEDAEIPEEEWRAKGATDGVGPRAAGHLGSGAGETDDGGERSAGNALRVSFVALALAATVVVPLYALSAAVRSLRGAPRPTARARARRRWALAVAALALGLGLATWTWGVPALRRLDARAPAPYGAPPRPRPPSQPWP